MPRFEFECGVCGARFDVARGAGDTSPVTCPADGQRATLRAIFGDGLQLRAPSTPTDEAPGSRVMQRPSMEQDLRKGTGTRTDLSAAHAAEATPQGS